MLRFAENVQFEIITPERALLLDLAENEPSERDEWIRSIESAIENLYVMPNENPEFQSAVDLDVVLSGLEAEELSRMGLRSETTPKRRPLPTPPSKKQSDAKSPAKQSFSYKTSRLLGKITGLNEEEKARKWVSDSGITHTSFRHLLRRTNAQ
jgi:hypothetical protein